MFISLMLACALFLEGEKGFANIVKGILLVIK